MPSRLFPQGGATAALFAVAALGLLGCGRPETASDRHFAELREQVDKIARDRDTIDQRIGALEVAVADEKGASVAAQPRNVVQLGGAEDDGADPNETGERPDIRVTGAGGVSAAPLRARSGKSGRARIEESEMPGGHPDGARSSALDPDAKASYEAALALVQGKQYDRGLEGLNAFLVRWPGHPYAENAIYWRGEAYFAQGEYLRAGEQFEAVIARFGSGKKAPDALLKLGMCQDRLGASARAREYWERLRTEYPKSEAAKRIPSGGRDSGVKGPKENR